MDTYPLQWPTGWPRTAAGARRYGNFQMHGSRTRSLLLRELSLLRATDVAVSSNVAIRRDGLPYANQSRPDDPGVVLYFKRKGQEIAIPCDRWATVDKNLRAIGMTVEAIRGLERWGTDQIVNAAFQGFTALPERVIVTPYTARPWHEVLEVSPSASEPVIRSAYKQRLHVTHPDHGGSDSEFHEVQRAWEEYRRQA